MQAYNVEYLYNPSNIKTRTASREDKFKNTANSSFMKATSMGKSERKS